MKKLLSVLIVFGLFTLCALYLGKNAGAISFNDKIYDFNSGYFKMTTTGPMNSGTEEVFIDGGGKVEARYNENTVNTPFGIKRTDKQITYRDGNIFYAYDPETNTAIKRDLKKDSEEFLKGANQKDMKSFSEEMIEKMGGKKIGREKLLNGKIEADVYVFENFGTKVWYYKKFPVKTYTNMAGMEMVSEVVEMWINKPVPQDKIRLPKGVKIVDAPSLKEIFSRMNAAKDTPEYQEHLKADDMSDMQDSMKEGAPQFQEVLKSLSDMFGNQNLGKPPDVTENSK